MKMLTKNMLQPLLQQMFKMSSHPIPRTQAWRCRLHSPVASSTTVCCMPDQTALRRCCSWFFKSVRSHSKWSLSILCGKFFHGSVSSKSSNLSDSLTLCMIHLLPRTILNYLCECNNSVFNSIMIKMWVQNSAANYAHKLRLQNQHRKIVIQLHNNNFLQVF